MPDDKKVVSIRKAEIVVCPRCGWMWKTEVEEIYLCDKCTARFESESVYEG